MKKLLTLTILLTTFIQADEGTQRDVCKANVLNIIEKGIEPCQENDILLDTSSYTSFLYADLLRICKVGTVNLGRHHSCVLRAEKDFGKVKDHYEYRKKKK